MPDDKIIKIELKDYMLYDQLHILAAEYSVAPDFLLNIAIKRLLDDVEFVRELRKGKAIPAHRQDGQT